MRKVVLILVVGLWASTAFADPPAPRPPLVAFRSRLVAGDPDRDFTYVWSREGGLADTGNNQNTPTYKVGGAPVPRLQLAGGSDGSDFQYHGGLRLLANTVAGTYTVDVGRGPELSVTVVTRPARTVLTASTTTSATTVASWFAAGYDVTLAAGDHSWDRMVVLPANATLRGTQATVRRAPGNSYGTNSPLVYIAGNDVSVYGITFVNDQPGGQVFISLTSPQPSGLVCGDCVFKRCNFGFFLRECYIRDCRFESGGAVIAPGGLWLRCTFTGRSVMHAWDYGSGSSPVAMIDPWFIGTAQGPVFNTAGGPITDHLYVGMHLTGVHSANSAEMLTFEGPGPFSRHLILHTRITGCSGAFAQWGGNQDGVADNNLINDLSADGGTGILWWGTVTRCTLQNFELRGGAGVYCGPNATFNMVSDGSIFDWSPGRGSASFPNPAPNLLGRKAAVVALGSQAATNIIQRVQVETIQPYIGVSGFTIK